MPKRIIYYVPIVLIIVLSVFFYFSLSNDTSKISSPIIGKPLPEFSLPSLLTGKPNVRSEMLNQDGTRMPELFIEDGLHMNKKGYEVWTKKVRESLSKDFNL